MNFSAALIALKQGFKASRKGWHGQGMFVYHIGADKYPAKTEAAKSIADEEGKVKYAGYFAIKLPDGHVSVWTPSTEDLLAEDWDVERPDKKVESEEANEKPRKGEDHMHDVVDMFILGLLLHALGEDDMDCDNCDKKDDCPIREHKEKRSAEKKEGKVNEPGKTRSK